MLSIMFREAVMSRIRTGRPPFGAKENAYDISNLFSWGAVNFDDFTRAHVTDAPGNVKNPIRTDIGVDTIFANDLKEWRWRIPPGKHTVSPHLLAACINAITSTTRDELRIAKERLSYGSPPSQVPIPYPYTGNVYVQFHSTVRGDNNYTDLHNALPEHSILAIYTKLRNIQLVFYVVDYTTEPVLKLCFIPQIKHN